MRYNWQQDDWGRFTFDLSAVESHLLLYTEKTAHLTGMLRALPEHLRSEAVVNLMTAEALKTSEIEGEFIQREDVMSSIRNNLGLNPVPEIVHDLRAIGLGQMMAEVRKNFAGLLNQDDLFQWYRLLLSYRQDLQTVGQWRQHAEPMQIVSGPMGRQRVHFEAPPSQAVPGMMEEFIAWSNRPPTGQETGNRNAPVRAAIAHIYFESIHPLRRRQRTYWPGNCRKSPLSRTWGACTIQPVERHRVGQKSLLRCPGAGATVQRPHPMAGIFCANGADSRGAS